MGTSQLYFVERSTGNILRVDPNSSAVIRVTNTLMPKIYEAYFARDGSVVMRSVNDAGNIITFAGSASSTANSNSTSTLGTLAGTYLPQNISALDVHPSTSTLVYLLADPKTGTVGVQSNWKNGGRKNIFSSRLVDCGLTYSRTTA